MIAKEYRFDEIVEQVIVPDKIYTVIFESYDTDYKPFKKYLNAYDADCFVLKIFRDYRHLCDYRVEIFEDENVLRIIEYYHADDIFEVS